MSNENSGRGQHCSNSFPICHIPLSAQTDIPCLCISCQSHASTQTFNPMQNHTLQNSSNSLTCQRAPISSFSVLDDPLQSSFHIQNDQEASKQMIKYADEIDSWLVFDIEEGQQNYLSYLNEGWLGVRDYYYNPPTEIQQHQGAEQGSHNTIDSMMPFQYLTDQAIQQHEQVIELHPGIDCDVSQDAVTNTTTILTQPQISVPLNEYGMEATIGNISNSKDVPTEDPIDQFPYSLIKSCNTSEPIIASSSDSNLAFRRRIRKFFSRTFKIRRYNFPTMSREEKVQRYLQKRKARKFGKKIRYASRKRHAENRPRVRGRFAKKLTNEVELS